MPLVNLTAILPKAKADDYAVGAFNVFDQLSMKAVVEAAAELNSPVIIQVLTPVAQFFGPVSIAHWMQALTKQHPRIPIVLHLDHGKDLNLITRCIESGWNSVMIDASDLPLDDNINRTKGVIEKARAAGVSVEGEVGCIFAATEKQSVRESADHLATSDSCRLYCFETLVDALAPAIGTAHGLYVDAPNINCDRLLEIGQTTDVPLVIHGGTGLSTQDFRNLIRCGASKINIATQIYMQYCQTMRAFTQSHPQSNDPLQFFAAATDDLKQRVKELIRVFGCADRI